MMSEPPHDDRPDDRPDDDLASAEDPDLRVALAGLSAMATSQVPLADMLSGVAVFAVRAIPGADGAGVTVLDDGRFEAVAASSELVDKIEEIQYGIGEGPCITAADERRLVLCGHLGRDLLWPRFEAGVSPLGIRSVVSLPLIVRDDVVGALNVYAKAEDAFDQRAATLAELYARPAAVSVQTARALARARTLASQLSSALTSRAVIDQAIGVLISRTGCSPAEGFEKLRLISQRENRKLAAVAQQVIDEAAKRARSRRAP